MLGDIGSLLSILGDGIFVVFVIGMADGVLKSSSPLLRLGVGLGAILLLWQLE